MRQMIGETKEYCRFVGEFAPDDSGIYTTEKGVFKFYGDELVGYAFDRETREAMREFFDTAYISQGMGFVGGDGAGSVRVEDCASVVGAVQVEMDEAADSVRTGGGEEQGECND